MDLSSEIKTIGDIGSSSVATGYSIAELNITYELIGQSLSELKMTEQIMVWKF